MTSTEARNKEIVRRINEEVWAAGNLDLIDEHVAEDYVEHSNASPEPIRGPAGYKANVREFHDGFSDVEVTTEDLIAEGNTVVNHWTFTATHTGEYAGIEPTGADVEFSGISIIDLEDGIIIEDRAVMDVSGLLQQLGVA